ncbi:trigger factor [bacterium]|nr:trigger factor [bacterium]
MKVTLTEQSPYKRIMDVTVDADVVEKAYAKSFKGALKMLAIPGFRRGKVPAYMGKKYITDSMLTRDVAEDLLPTSFYEAIKQEELSVLGQPEFKDVKVERGKELTFTASFEVIPMIEIKDFEGIEVEQEKAEPTDEDVDKYIEELRKRRFTLEEVKDRALETGDVAVFDYESFEEGKPVEGGQAKDVTVELVPEKFAPGFVDNLLGMNVDEIREFDFQFPEEHKSELAGHKVHFIFTLKKISKMVYPELDDDFVKMVSNDAKNVEELRRIIKTNMEEEVKRNVEQHIAEQIYFKLSPQIPTDVVPPALVRRHAAIFNARVMANLEARGSKFEDMLKEQNITEEDWKKHISLMGYGEARLEMLVKGIARQLDMKVDEEDINEAIDYEAARSHQTTSYIRRQMEESGYIYELGYSILRDKVTQHLVDNAKVTYLAPGTLAARKAAEEAKKAEEEAKEDENTESVEATEVAEEAKTEE